jgi:hypothetical protein
VSAIHQSTLEFSKLGQRLERSWFLSFLYIPRSASKANSVGIGPERSFDPTSNIVRKTSSPKLGGIREVRRLSKSSKRATHTGETEKRSWVSSTGTSTTVRRAVRLAAKTQNLLRRVSNPNVEGSEPTNVFEARSKWPVWMEARMSEKKAIMTILDVIAV